SEMDLRSALSTVQRQEELDKQRKEEEARKRKQAETKLDLYKRLNAAIAELTSFGGAHFESTPQRGDGGFLVPAAVRPVQLFVEEIGNRQQLARLDLIRAQA